MSSVVAPKVAVIGCGISGAVCASTLAKNGVSVTVFDLGRGPGGRMSQRRETIDEGRELFFDHGAAYFTAIKPSVLDVVLEWESKGFVAEWKEKFGTFDCFSKRLVDSDVETSSRKYVGIPGMNSICGALCNEPGVDSRFGVGVGKLEHIGDQNIWSLLSLNGQFLGHFSGLIGTDKLLASPGFSNVTGQPPPIGQVLFRLDVKSLSNCYLTAIAASYIDMNLAPQFASRMQEIPVRSCFALMLAFNEPLQCIPVKGFSFTNSEVLRSAFCDSSKPGRSSTSECWVLHSTAEYAKKVITQCDDGLKKPSNVTLTKVAEELLQEFQSTGLCTAQPYFMKAHRWGSAFPTVSIAVEDKCLWDTAKKFAVCGDFCVSPSVEGAIESGLAAASKMMDMLFADGNHNSTTKVSPANL